MKKGLQVLLLIILIFAFFFFGGEDEVDTIATNIAKEIVPDAAFLENINRHPPSYFVYNQCGEKLGYFGIGEAPGYGGPLQVGVAIDLAGEIIGATIVSHKETPSYYEKIIEQERYLEALRNKHVSDPFEIEKDLDAISRATITCCAIAEASRQVSHYVGREELHLDIKSKDLVWKVGAAEIAVAILFITVIVLTIILSRYKARKIILLVSTVILGFWLNRPISIGQISGGFLGYFPSCYTNLMWYLVLGVGIGLPLFLGKNIYCYWLCPFGGVQELANKISGVNLTFKAYERKIRTTRNALLWISLLIVFVTRNPNLGAYEPFGTIFGFTGSQISWLLLFVVMVASMFSRRFWCNYFCPVGAFLDYTAKLHRYIKRLLKNVLVRRQPIALKGKKASQG